MKTKLALAGDNFRLAAGAEWRSVLEIPTYTLLDEARCADLIVIEKGRRSMDFYRAVDSGTAILGEQGARSWSCVAH
jgi:hypothetical protein